MNVGKTIPESDKAIGFGFHHTARFGNEGKLVQEYADAIIAFTLNFCSGNGVDNDALMRKIRYTYHGALGKCLISMRNLSNFNL